MLQSINETAMESKTDPICAGMQIASNILFHVAKTMVCAWFLKSKYLL